MSNQGYQSMTVILPPSINQDNLNIRALSLSESESDLSDSPPDADPDPTSKQFAGSMTHFILAASLNFIGIFMSCIIKTPGQALFVPCSLGLSVNCVLVSIPLWAFVAIRHAWCLEVVVCACVALGALAVSLFLAVGAYRSLDSPGSERGLASEFVFYTIVGLLTPPFGLFGMFHSSRRANLGSGLGTLTALCIAVPCLCCLLLGTPGAFVTTIYIVLWAVTLVLFLMICYRDDIKPFLIIFYFLTILSGPYGFVVCLGGPHVIQVYGFVGLLSCTGVVTLFVGTHFPLVLLITGALALVGITYVLVLVQRSVHGDRFTPL